VHRALQGRLLGLTLTSDLDFNFVSGVSPGGQNPVSDAKSPVRPGGASSQQDHPEPVIRYDPTTILGWWRSSGAAIRKHRKSRRVQMLYDALLKLINESTASDSYWSKFRQRWVPSPCSSANRRHMYYCRVMFHASTSSIIKHCNVSSSVFFEVVLATSQHDEVAKHRDFFQQCLASIRSRRPPQTPMPGKQRPGIKAIGGWSSPRCRRVFQSL
jgi:hypothetical protein